MAKVAAKPIRKGTIVLTIVGTSPLITHAWPEKAKQMMREKHAGKKTKTREVRDPEAEAMDAAYTTPDGKFGILGLALKTSLVTAAHKDVGIEKTLVRKSLFLELPDPSGVLPLLEQDMPEVREDMVRVGAGSADLRYRPMWSSWRVRASFVVDFENLTPDDVATLVTRAGFGVGLGEWRPEKGGEFGRFEIDTSEPYLVEVEE